MGPKKGVQCVKMWQAVLCELRTEKGVHAGEVFLGQLYKKIEKCVCACA